MVCFLVFSALVCDTIQGYSSHKCNGLYEEDANTKSKKAELERYKHYSERYETHQLSAKLEQKMLVHEEAILGVMKSEGFLGNDFSPAVYQILEVCLSICRIKLIETNRIEML